MKFRANLTLLALVATLLPGLADAQCPDQLLWTNGSIWAYRAVNCGGDNCTEATDKVLFYSEEQKQTGCEKKDDACKCRSEGEAISGAVEVEPDQAVQNRGCQNIDAFVVKIGDDHVQCVEFRFVPNPMNTDDFGQQVARNMRVSFKLKGEPKQGMSNLLVDDSAKVDGNAVSRKFGDTNVSYPMLSSGSLTLDKLVTREAPKPVPPTPVKQEERPGPDDDGDEDHEGDHKDEDHEGDHKDEDHKDEDHKDEDHKDEDHKDEDEDKPRPDDGDGETT